jgi:hypothetical protein
MEELIQTIKSFKNKKHVTDGLNTELFKFLPEVIDTILR